MATALSVFPLAIELAFLLLAVALLVDWLRHRERRRGYLAGAFGSLTLLVLIAPVLGQVGAFNQALTDVEVVLLLLSGLALVMFRDALIPLGRRTRRAVTAVIVAVAVLGVAAQLPADPQHSRSAFQTLALAALLTAWGLCVVWPALTMWLASRTRPAVEGARMRALSFGYLGLVAVILAGSLGGAVLRNEGAQLALDIVALAMAPILYISFSPPTWLRRLWSQTEEHEFRQGLHSLLTYSPDRVTQAQRALEWATRLVGAAGAFIIDSDGSVLAARGMTVQQARETASGAGAITAAGRRGWASPPAATLVVPLQMQQGAGSLVILAGPFTPVFGDDEVVRLHQFAASVTVGLDRVLLNQRVAALEKAKTEFLNIASHELRTPMTVIKGYLTMIEAGSLGDVPSRAKAVLPVMIAKADEVNSMIEQMIQAARLEDGRLALQKEEADIVELTQAAIDELSPLVAGHELTVEKPPVPVMSSVDPERFKIIVRNLVSNAAKYSPAGSPIVVMVSRSDDVASVAVIDQGVGIAQEDLARLFTRFGRIENDSTLHVAGTGLGLWLSREIARMHDGDLTVMSALGKGSTFTLQVPVNP